MSFLNQLKSQANALQNQQGREQRDVEQSTADAEAACSITWQYFQDLARQLNVIVPAGPKLSLDGKTVWPAMKLATFRVDARKKKLRDREVFDYVAMGWRILPQADQPEQGTVSVNFPPELERVESRLAMGMVRHERKELRDPEKNALLAIRFDHAHETRGNVTVRPDHDTGVVAFRCLNLRGFEIVNRDVVAAKLKTDVLDDLARMIVSEPSRFV